MYGAIYGDIIGSRFEFDRGGRTKDFQLFTDEDSFTDDSVMTIAVADGLLKAGRDASVEKIKESVIRSMQSWGRKYPDAGYGGRFFWWLFLKNPKPYGSYGNGSAMRVSAAGWLYDSLERTREVARATAEVTHNHPEGVKGADATASVIFLGRTGTPKEKIKEFVKKEFDYNLSESLDEMRLRHEHVETCMDSLPKALVSFFEGESYEDVVRNAVSLGGDTDTLGAIAGAMAEAYYGIPVRIVCEGNSFIFSQYQDMKEVLERFNAAIGRSSREESDEDSYEKNKYIRMAIGQIHANPVEKSYYVLLDVILKRLLENGMAPTPMVDVNGVMDTIDADNLKVGDTISLSQDMRLRIDTMQDPEGRIWIPLFTDEEELHKQPTANVVINMDLRSLLAVGADKEDVTGVIINPFTEAFPLEKPLLKAILGRYQEIVAQGEE